MKNIFKSMHKNRIGKRVTSLLVAGVLVMASMPLSEMYEGFIDLSNSVVVHAAPRQDTVTFSNMSEFVTYSQEYASNAASWCEDTLVLTFSDTEVPETFVSLGTSANPFNGKVYLNATSGSDYYTLQLDKPLFNYVTDSVKINKNGTENPIQLNIQRTSDLDETANSPLLANTIKHNDGSANWIIRSEVYDDGENKKAFKFSGVIGSLDTNAQVKLEFDNSSRNDEINDPSKINGTNAIGLICGTMESNSKITLSLKNGTNTDGIIESKGSHAGGIIGEMKNNSILIIKNDSFVPSTNRIIKAASGKSAGGIVGYSDGGRIEFVDGFSGSVAVRGNVKGGNASGGVFGNYKNTSSDEIDLSKFIINCKAEGTSVGGVFGVAETSSDLTVKDGSLTIEKNDVNGVFGGIAGIYKTNDHLKKFDISGVTVNTSTAGATTSYGGAIGEIQNGTTTDYAYIKANNFTHVSTSGCNSTLFGGVVGRSANQGNLLDIGTVTISTGNTEFTGGGLVGDLSKGVLRLSGITNLISAPSAASDTSNRNRGQIVGKRKDALIYALGNGSNTTTATFGNDWGLKRSTTDVNADDVGTWGEIVRIGYVETNIVSYDSTNHTVTLNGFNPETTIDNDVSFALLALNIQLNAGDIGALKFSSSATSSSAYLLGANITVSGTISLSGTGITGLMRDDYSSSENEIGLFTGHITGESDATINLAIGERYGYYTGTPVGRGAIFNHRFNGLLARTGAGASLSNLVIGSIGTEDTPDNYGWNINSNAPYIDKIDETPIDVGTYVGGVAARVTSGITLTDVDCVERINFNVCGGSGSYIGGYIGEVTKSNSAAITIQKSSNDSVSVSPTIIVSGNLDSTHAIGGVIGRINSTNTFTTSLSDVTLNTSIDATAVTSGSTVKDIATAGLISKIVGGKTDNRTLSLTNITADGVSIKNNAGDRSGGILGYSWLNTNATFANVTLDKSGDDINTVHTSAKYVGGLVFSATGHWTVPSGGIVINSFKDDRSSATSFGMLVNDGYEGSNGLFLELTASDSYTLGTDNTTVPTPTQAYDELVAYTSSTANWLKNGKDNNLGVGIVSITTTKQKSTDTESKLVMSDRTGTNATTNSYQNKKNQLSNKYSRYYYNLTIIRNKASKSDGEKLLLWSLNHYASSNLSTYFPNAYARSGQSDKIDGTDFDMINLSYYPIDINKGTEIGNINVKFYSNYIENSEQNNAKYINSGSKSSSDNVYRSSLSETQHYLMHFGLFKNASNSISTSGDISFRGLAGSNDTYSGVLICGNLTGSFEASDSKEIVLNGIRLRGFDPESNQRFLLINSIGNKATLKLRKVRTGGSTNFSGATISTEISYTSDAEVASSLIGSVKGNGITLEFEKIKLDARNGDGNTDYSSLDDIYGTSRSIFTDAVLLSEFDVDTGSSAVYNFEESEDWDGSTHKGNVTYGQEIITSVEFADKQNKYYDQNHFTHPIPVSTDAKYDNFQYDFLPYVAVSTATGDETGEIRVNVKISGIVKGCGTYNHPYEIEEHDQLPAVANAIAGTAYPQKLRLPKINGSAANTVNHWADTCESFELSGENYTFSETVGSTTTTYTWSKDQVRLYLASAYYMIMKDITLDASFTGLGSVAGTDYTGKYSFRGVIVGKKKSDNSFPIITNKAKRIDNGDGKHSNTLGLISMSNGSVIKDLTIKVAIDRTSYGGNLQYDYKSTALAAYEYNEVFPNYGAVINKIMGGDNIIDNVKVDYNGDFNVLKDGNDHTATIGGYVGCVVNGGLVFRNTENNYLTTNGSAGFTVNKVNADGSDSSYKVNNKSITNMTSIDDVAHLYVNPFVGRVINGYVFRETESSYNTSEDGKYSDPDLTSENKTRSGVTQVGLKNTRKNYVIPDIDASQNYQSTDSAKRESVLTFKEKTENSGLYNKIDIPNSQALYIMSIIAQSGVGCAGSDTKDTENGNYAYTISFDGDALRKHSGNQKGNTYKASRHANYNDIGSSASSASGSDYDISRLDTVNSKTAVPYIIYKYTSSYTSGTTTYYPARALTKRYFYISLTGSGTYYLPDCFRGIGFIGSDDIDDFMKIYGFNGNGKTIDMNSVMYHYKKDNDAFFSGTGGNMNSGLALFNRLTQYCADTSNTRAYDPNTENQIYNFTLQGYISADCLTNAGAETYNTDESGKIFRTAGLVSYANIEKYYNVANVSLNNLHVKSCEYAGGLFAKIDTGKIYLNNCNATNLKVEGYCRTGGFIGNNNGGTQYDGIFINTASDTSSSTLSNITVLHKGSSDNKFSCVGGVVGQFYTSKTDLSGVKNQNNYGHVIIRNISLSNSRVESVGVVGKTGGIMGSLQQSTASLFLNCNVYNTNISGKYTGGIIGDTTASNDVFGMRIVNCTVSGTINQTTQSPNYSISGTKYVGGIIGYDKTKYQNDNHYPKYNGISYKLNVEGCLVENYKICGVNSDNGGSGGIAGTVANAGAYYTFKIADSKVNNCTIQSSNGQNTRGTGAIIGYNATSGKFVYGRNVVVNNNIVQNTSNTSDGLVGNIIGNANSALQLKLVGYSRKDNKKNSSDLVDYDIGRASGTANIPSTCDTTNSYIIYSDYGNKCVGDSPNKLLSTFDKDSFVDPGVRGTGYEYFPYVVVNPTTNMGTGSFLTGDAAALNSSSEPLVKDIISDTSANGYIGVSDTTKTVVSTAVDSVDDSQNKISTYKTETNNAPFGFDFPVVVVNNQLQQDSASLIDNYIKLMTNSSLDYRNNKSKVYKIDNIYACTYKNNKYSIDTSEGVKAGLKYSTSGNGVFFMEKGYADSNQENNQISLIDVEFFDPNDSTKVAYHLYVPVLTKKMVSFSFNSASLTGTDFKVSTQDASSPTPYVFGNKLAETLGTWYTSYLMFTYPRSELQDLVDSGKGLSWNHNKIIQLNYKNTDGKLGDNTKLVLIDMNNSDKAYYSTMGTIRTESPDGQGLQTDMINLKDFKTKTSGGTSFEQCILSDLVTVTAEAKSSGTYAVLEQNDDPDDFVVVKAKLNGVETSFKYVGENNGGTHKLTVDGDGYERYFLSFLTPTTGTLYEYTITSPKNLSPQAGGLKGLRNDQTSSYTTIVIGDLFKQTVTLEKVALDGNQSSPVVDAIYNQIQVDVNSTIEIANSSYASYLTSHLSDPTIHLYHAFVLYFNKHKEDGTDTNIIGGNPGVTTSFTVDTYDGQGANQFTISTDQGEVVEGASTSYPGGKTYAILEKHDIKQLFIDSPEKKITIASKSVVDYSDGNDRLEGFPEASSAGTIGVNISAKSNLSYNGTEEKIVYGTMTKNATPPSTKNYYREDSGRVSLSYDAKVIDDAFDKDGILSKNKSQLGLNAKNLADATRTFIPLETVASYNASNVTEFAKAKSIKCTLKLYKKTDSGSSTDYVQITDLSKYFAGKIKLRSTGTSMATINSEVTVPNTSEVSFIGTNIDTTKKAFDADIDFNAIIKNGGFRDYANYKVELTVQLFESDGTTTVDGSLAFQHIVYTNAKIDPSIIRAS